MDHIWPTHIDSVSKDDLRSHLKELIAQHNTLDGVDTLEQLAAKRGKVEGFRYLLSLVQSTK